MRRKGYVDSLATNALHERIEKRPNACLDGLEAFAVRWRHVVAATPEHRSLRVPSHPRLFALASEIAVVPLFDAPVLFPSHVAVIAKRELRGFLRANQI
jgi:hypothetical protein